jgi:putative spermidine/putrescine transport system permease protein
MSSPARLQTSLPASGWVGRALPSLVAGLAWTVVGFLILPMLVVLLVSLTDQPYLSLPRDGPSLQYYRNFFSSADWMSAAGQSLLVAFLSTLLAVLMGTACAIACWRLSGRYANFVRLLVMLPMMVPTVIEGLAMHRAWVFLGMFDTVSGLVLAHAMTGLPYVLVTVTAALARFDVRQEQAARSLGASVPVTVIWVICPQIMPGILSGALFAFVHSFDELVVTLFLTSRLIATLPKQMWSGIQENLDPTIAAVSALLILATSTIIIADRYLKYRRRVRAVGTAGVSA